MNFNIGQLIKSTYPGDQDVRLIIKILPSTTYLLVEYLSWNSNGKLLTAYLYPGMWKVIA